MNKESIISLPHSSLRTKSAKVKDFDDALTELAKDMSAATLDWEASRPHEFGVALAAVQVNRLERVVIVREDFENKENDRFIVLINPKIVQTGGKQITEHEGCLSIKNVYGKVARWEKVKVRALDLEGNEFTIKAEHFLARVLQHEIDHTNGIVFIDHIRDKVDAFARLDAKGKLEPLDYDTQIKDNNDLWED